MPEPNRCAEVLGREDHADEAVRLGRIVRGTQLEHQLVLRAEIDLLHMAPPAQVPYVEPMAIVTLDQALDAEPVLEHVGCAPFAGDRDVVAEVPPEIVSEELRTAVDLPLTEHVEALMVQQKDPAGTAAVGAAHCAYVDRVGAAMERMRATVAGARRDLLGLNHLDDFRR